LDDLGILDEDAMMPTSKGEQNCWDDYDSVNDIA
jgi:hypothetical protein